MTLEERVIALENRTLKIELRINELINAMNKLATTTQIGNLSIILQTDIDQLRTTLANLETRVNLLEIET